MKSAIRLSFFLLATIILNSCSKESVIERRLARRSGKWNIELYEAKYYDNGYYVGQETYANAGYFIFDEDGTVIQTITTNGQVESTAGTWSNTKNEITFIQDGNATVWRITDDSRKSLTIEFIDYYSDETTDYRDEFRMELEKD